MQKRPHPIPYQGSKRRLADAIGRVIPNQIGTWYEPFAGSAAMTIWVAQHRTPKRIVLGDSLPPLAELWRVIINNPEITADRYEQVWLGQDGAVGHYFNEVRARFNANGDPVDLLYLLCRCVKNAVRFNRKGEFTQSVDKRRFGMRPDKMRNQILGASTMLKDRTEVRTGDWLDSVRDAKLGDFIYLDPPYMGTSQTRDTRYAEQMGQQRLINGLEQVLERGLSIALSYDGMTGEKTYGPPLPAHLNMTRTFIHTGRSSQATLSGKEDETIESLYLSIDLDADFENIRVGKERNDEQHQLLI
ncbi:MAG: DNA adenine methylase, partial [Allosphingosinicella sp.]